MVIGAVGGLGGIAAATTVLAQRRKLRAEAAGAITNAAGELTDTALELMDPLRSRIRERESEVRTTKRSAASANDEVERLRDSVRDLTTLMRRWRAEILAPDANLDALRRMVQTVPEPRNGRSPL